MGDCRVEGDLDRDGGACRFGQQQPALQGCHGGQGQTVQVGISAHLPGDHHGPQRAYEQVLPPARRSMLPPSGWQLPVPATCVIDRAGVVRAAHVSADYRTRMEPADIVTALDELTC